MSKKININPDFFKISGRSAVRKKRTKMKPFLNTNTLKPNDIKKKLIARIKAHQQKEKLKMIEERKKTEDKFKDEFKDTLNYLEQMKKKEQIKKRKKKEKKERNRTLKKAKIQQHLTPTPVTQSTSSDNKNNSYIPIHTGTLDSHDTADPPYGCLKNGKKPTWKQWNKTRKREKENTNENTVEKAIHFKIPVDISKNSEFEARQHKLHLLKNKFKTPEVKKRKIRTRRIKRKITLGKRGNKVGVLVKNKTTRKIIKNEVNVLKKKSIQEVKEYLRKHNLVKIGSNAPEYIVRSIYENAYLSGDVKNKNPEILLYNWKQEEGDE